LAQPVTRDKQVAEALTQEIARKVLSVPLGPASPAYTDGGEAKYDFG
jgi:hypothetical protein